MIQSIPRILILVLAATSFAALAEVLPRPEPIGKPATKVYRQVLPDGRILYSDRRVKGAKLDQTFTVEPPASSGASGGTGGSSASGKPAEAPPRTAAPADRVSTLPPPGRTRTMDDANADVIRAEMLLEDARKRRDAGAEPLPGERVGTATGGSRLSDDYHARQKRLAEEVAVAENVLRRSIADRDALREGR